MMGRHTTSECERADPVSGLHLHPEGNCPMGKIGYRFLSGVNPGPRYPKVGKVQTATDIARRNATLVAFLIGELVGSVLMFVARL